MESLNINLSYRKNVSVDSIIKEKARVLGLYKAYLFKLYDLGYTNQPNVFSYQEILASLNSFGRTEKFVRGKVDLSPYYIAYELDVARKSNADETHIEFLELLYNCVYWREVSNKLDVFWEQHKLLSKTRKTLIFSIGLINHHISVSSSKAGLPLECFGLLVDDNEVITIKDIHTPLGNWIKENEPDMFSEDLEPYYSDILGSNMVLSGRLHIKNFRSPYDRVSKILGSLDVKASINLASSEVMSVLSSLPAGSEYIGGHNGKVVFKKPRSEEDKTLVPLGHFLLDYSSGGILHPYNRFSGVCGDMVTAEDGYICIGAPVKLYNPKGELSLYYDSEQCVNLGDFALVNDLGLDITLQDRGSSAIDVEDKPTSLVNFFLDSDKLIEEGVSLRVLTGNFTSEQLEEAKLEAAKQLFQERGY